MGAQSANRFGALGANGPASESRGRARIGVVVPVSNTNFEPDLNMLRPEGVSLHFARAGAYDLDAVPDGAQMRRFATASLDGVLTALLAARPDMILYGCTSATLSHGPTFDREFQARIEREAGVLAVIAAGAVFEVLTDLGVRRIGFTSPYVRSLNEGAADFLRQSGFEVVATAHAEGDLGNYGVGALTPGEVHALGLNADHEDAEAIVLSCTDMQAVEAIPMLEHDLGKPVVTRNQALMRAAKERLGLEADGMRAGYG